MAGRVWLTISEKKVEYPGFSCRAVAVIFLEKWNKNWIGCTFYEWTRIRNVFWKFQTKWKKWHLKYHEKWQTNFSQFFFKFTNLSIMLFVSKNWWSFILQRLRALKFASNKQKSQATFYALWTDESFASQREKTLSENFPRAQKSFSSLRDVFSLHDTVYSQHSVT